MQSLYTQRTEGLESRRLGKMQVWHLTQECFLNRLRWRNPVWPDHYDLVAVLKTFSLDEAFRWTNQLEDWRRPEVELLSPYGPQRNAADSAEFTGTFLLPRSTSVDDVLVTPSRVAYLVTSFGFRQIARI